MFGLLPLIYIFLTCLTRVYAIVEAPEFDVIETLPIGNPSAAKWQVRNFSTSSTARYFKVNWDGDKVLGTHVHKIYCLFL